MEQVLRFLPPRPASTAVRYALSAALVAICAATVKLLHAETGVYAFFIFYLAIFLASVLFDHGSGFVATALSVLFMYFQLAAGGKSVLEDITPLLGSFVAISVGVAFVSEGLRVGWERAIAAEQVKDLLLQELRHRTKNDLAMVVSVLSLQARGEAEPVTKAALENAIARIRAIAGAHDHFGPLSDEAQVDIKDYLTKLCGHLGDSLRDVRPIKVEVEVESTVLKSRDAIPIGLIVNELVTNALKHAFPENRAGTVRVTLDQASPPILTVEDNGAGCPPAHKEGLGSRLTKLLVRQLGGSIAWEDAAPGCRVRVTLLAAE